MSGLELHILVCMHTRDFVVTPVAGRWKSW